MKKSPALHHSRSLLFGVVVSLLAVVIYLPTWKLTFLVLFCAMLAAYEIHRDLNYSG
jgi:hypothetical protein